MNRWGHWAAQLLIAVICVAVLLRIFPVASDGLLSMAAPVALMALVVASWLLMRTHDRGLCERCLKGMPLNASEVAVRQHRRLATAHLGTKRLLVAAYFAVLIGSAFLPGAVGLVIWCAAQTSMIYLLLSYTSHRRLQPWCRACRGRGGDEHNVDAPDPVPAGLHNA